MKVRIRGKVWRWVWDRSLMVAKGITEGPHVRGKRIRVRPSLRGRERLEVMIHELLHAALWDLDEEAIDETAHDVARVLWRLGVRV